MRINPDCRVVFADIVLPEELYWKFLERIVEMRISETFLQMLDPPRGTHQ